MAAAPRRSSRALAGLTLMAVLAWGASAHAVGRDDDKRECLAASESAQMLRMHNKLRESRDKLLVCAREVCPAVISHDCGQWLSEVTASLPTVVISALDPAGQDVGAVRVEVDGAPFLDKLDGSAVPVDPGDHTFVFFHQGDAPVTQKVIVREGEKNRLLSVRFPGAAAPAPSGAVVLPGPPAAAPALLVTPPETGEEKRSSATLILAWSLVAAGAVGLGFGAYFEVTQVHDYNTLSSTCAPSHMCSLSSVNTVTNDRVLGFVSLAAGIAAAGTGTVLLVLRSRHGSEKAAWLGVAPSPSGAAATLHLSF
jgi:hypothetical protein